MPAPARTPPLKRFSYFNFIGIREPRRRWYHSTIFPQLDFQVVACRGGNQGKPGNSQASCQHAITSGIRLPGELIPHTTAATFAWIPHRPGQLPA